METKNQMIWCHEVAMSRLIIETGGNIGSMCQLYSGMNFCAPVSITPIGKNGDIAYPGAYFGNHLSPYEVMFIKINRGYPDEWLKLYTGN